MDNLKGATVRSEDKFSKASKLLHSSIQVQEINCQGRPHKQWLRCSAVTSYHEQVWTGGLKWTWTFVNHFLAGTSTLDVCITGSLFCSLSWLPDIVSAVPDLHGLDSASFHTFCGLSCARLSTSRPGEKQVAPFLIRCCFHKCCHPCCGRDHKRWNRGWRFWACSSSGNPVATFLLLILQVVTRHGARTPLVLSSLYYLLPFLISRPVLVWIQQLKHFLGNARIYTEMTLMTYSFVEKALVKTSSTTTTKKFPSTPTVWQTQLSSISVHSQASRRYLGGRAWMDS